MHTYPWSRPHQKLGEKHFALMADFLAQWDEGVEVRQVDIRADETVRGLECIGLLLRPEPDLVQAWPDPLLPLSPYSRLSFRPRSIWPRDPTRYVGLCEVQDEALRARWVMHGDISSTLEECVFALWQVILHPRGGGCSLTPQGISSCEAPQLPWLSAVLPVFMDVLSDIRQDAAAWTSARRAGTHEGSMPDWKKIISARLRPLRAYWHESTARFFEP